jgi:glycosyltransferase involved in cell wall biosynthesis
VTYPIFYDLTELFTASSKFRYYGIARVVQEIALELHRINSGVRYVIYSPGHRQFFEIHPSFPETDTAANLILGIEGSGSPLRIRQTYHSQSRLGIFLERFFSRACQIIDLYRWRRANINLSRADLRGAILIAAGRPKIIVEYLDALNDLQPSVRFMPFLHDMIPLIEYGKTKPRPFAVNFLHDNQRIISQASKVLCNSYFTRSEIKRCEASGLTPKAPSVLPVQLAHQCRQSEEVADISLPTDPYLLCVGSTVGRKNVECVFDALLILAKAGKHVPKLALAGVYRDRVKKYLARDVYSPIRNSVLFFPNPNQTDLLRLYQNALALILPSWTEGWGLPVGEALWLGTPAICSDTPVLHEVAGEAGIYFAPSDPTALSLHIDRILTDQVFKEILREKVAQKKQSLRTWRNVAQDLLKAVSD